MKRTAFRFAAVTMLVLMGVDACAEYPTRLIKGVRSPDEVLSQKWDMSAPIPDIIGRFASWLNFSYLVDPGVTGSAAVVIQRDITAREAWQVFEYVLQEVGAQAVINPGFCHILPKAKIDQQERFPPKRELQAWISEDSAIAIKVSKKAATAATPPGPASAPKPTQAKPVTIDESVGSVPSQGSAAERSDLVSGGGLVSSKTNVAGKVRITSTSADIPSQRPSPGAPEPVPALTVGYGACHALVVGASDYRGFADLEFSIRDARTVAEVLRSEYGFAVTLLLNPTRSSFLMRLADYRKRLTHTDNLLIYYAGHGWLDRDADQGYWLPTDASPGNKSNWVSNADITSEVRAIEAKHVMIVADSCYSGKLTRGLTVKQRNPNYWSRMAAKKARVVLSSGGLEPVMDSGGKGNHSVFASAFIDALRGNTGILDGATLFSEVRQTVGWNADQTPEYAVIHKAGHDGGDFLFVHRSVTERNTRAEREDGQGR